MQQLLSTLWLQQDKYTYMKPVLLNSKHGLIIH